MRVSVIFLVVETILFTWLLIILDKTFDWDAVWRQFISLKESVRPKTKVKSSSGDNIS